MRIRIIYYLALAAILFSLPVSCISDRGRNGTEEEVGEERYISFGLNAGQSASDTRAEEYPQYGTDAEMEIDEIYLLLYDASGGELKYAWSLDAATVPSSDSGNFGKDFEGSDVAGSVYNYFTNYGFITTARKVSVSSYYAVVIANPGQLKDSDIDAASGKISASSLTNARYRTLTGLQAELAGMTPDDFGAEYARTGSGNKFFMSNANGPVPVAAADFYETEAEAEINGNAVEVYVDRGLAKILLVRGENFAVTNGTTLQETGIVADLRWGVAGWNRKVYPLRQYAVLPTSFYPEGTMEDYDKSVYIYKNWMRDFIYATDPNMTRPMDPADFGADDPGSLFMEWNTYQKMEWYSDYGRDHFLYCTENTMDVSAQNDNGGWYSDWHEYTTHVFINAWIKILGFGAEPDYYSYYDAALSEPQYKVFTWAQASRWWADDTFPDDMPGLKAVLAAIQPDVAAQEPGWRVFDFFDAGMTQKPEYLPADGTYYTESEHKVISFADAGGTVKIFYHRGGINQYRVPIYHIFDRWDDTIGLDDYAYLGVVRNNIYTVIVNRIIGPGTEGDMAYISAEVSVTPWYKRTQDNTLDPQ